MQDKLMNFRSEILNRLVVLKRLGYVFVPQLIRTLLFNDPVSRQKAGREITSTAYLSGLRGLAAILVFRGHFIKAFTKQLWLPYDPSGANYHVDFPIIRIMLYTGGPAFLPIFFVVSGYFNSLKFLQLMQQNNAAARNKMFHMFSSAVPRRLFRLYLPVMTMMVIVSIIAHLGLFEFIESHRRDFKVFEAHPKHMVEWYDQLYLLLDDWSHMFNFFSRGKFRPLLNPHLWTMSWEFRSTIVIYTSLLAVARASSTMRLVLLTFIAAFAFICDQWESFCFTAGVALAQLDVRFPVDSDTALPELPVVAGNCEYISEKLEAPETNHSGGMVKALLGVLFLVAGWLMSAPTNGTREAWGYLRLSRLLIPPSSTTPDSIIPIFGVILLILVLRQCSLTSPAKRLLNHSTVQYLGNHTFAIYLVHGPWLHLFGYYIPILMWKVLDREFLPSWIFGLFIGYAVNLCIVLVLADIWAREVDSRCARMVGLIERRLFIKQE